MSKQLTDFLSGEPGINETDIPFTPCMEAAEFIAAAIKGSYGGAVNIETGKDSVTARFANSVWEIKFNVKTAIY